MVGDSIYDLIVGQLVGMICVVVLIGIVDVEDFVDYVDVILNFVVELLGLLCGFG